MGYSPWGHRESDMTKPLSSSSSISFEDLVMVLHLILDRRPRSDEDLVMYHVVNFYSKVCDHELFHFH